jgi:hypothetical protein
LLACLGMGVLEFWSRRGCENFQELSAWC